MRTHLYKKNHVIKIVFSNFSNFDQTDEKNRMKKNWMSHMQIFYFNAGLNICGRRFAQKFTHASELYSIPSESFAITWICSDSI